MRLGGPVFKTIVNPETWVLAVQEAGYRAAFCPVNLDSDRHTVSQYTQAAQEADIIIAEVGVWNNPLSSDENERKIAIERCKQGLTLADQMNAWCCVNIAGSRSSSWQGPCSLDLTDETFEMIVESVREIIDAVQPSHSFYTLETMPWMYPDSADSYLRLIRAIDRQAFAVHFDPANLISSPQRYFTNAELIQDFISRLGSYIRSCHAKDVLLHECYTVHLEEMRPGQGGLNYRILLTELSKLSADLPLMLEHLPSEQEYIHAAKYIRKIANEERIAL